jgi:ABC-type glycerol-3-phosphate transport system substrate-binding protein
MGKLYFTTSDANIITNDAIWVLYFNKKIVADLQLTDPYAMVNDGTWTIDKMYDMARASAIDIDGDGTFTISDQWGVSTHGAAFLPLLAGQGEHLFELNSEGIPELITPTDRFINAFANAHLIMNKEAGVFLDAQGTYPGRNADYDHAKKTFMGNMSLFCSEVLAHARVFREMEADFGIIPHPKYDEMQESYYTFMIDTIPAFGIPVTASDIERTAVFMDAFTAVSAETIIPAYYKISLEGKFTRDEESVKMLDLIRETRIFELGVLYNWGSFQSQITAYGIGNDGSNPGTLFEKYAGSVSRAIERTIDSYNSIGG